MKHKTGLDVFLQRKLVGHLHLDERRRFVFQYDPRWLSDPAAIPVSISLPLRPEIYDNDMARPFFSNLLPEGEVKRIIARKFGISEQNDYALLENIGGECAGAVSILVPGQTPEDGKEYQALTEEALDKIITQLPRRPLLAGEEGIRLSLAGAQNKLPVCIDQKGTISVPLNGSPSTHILKSSARGFDGIVENEAFCMALAERVGIPVPKTSIRRNRHVLLFVDRYDRRKQGNRIIRLHQEDVCQALGILPDQKYEAEGGPTLKSCADLLKRVSIRPAADLADLLRWTVFNVVIGNADAHAKNISILYTEGGPRLAPFYDLVSTRVYPEINDKYAMRIGGEKRPGKIFDRHWERFAYDLSMKWSYVSRIRRDLMKGILAQAESLAELETFREIGIIKNILEVIRREAL